MGESLETAPSPHIVKVGWGQIEVEGCTAPFKDAKLYPGGARAWDWDETGTSHSPGIQPADVRELLDHGVTVVVLSRGVYERLSVCPETLAMLADRGVESHVLPTTEAVEVYNRLADSEPVGGLFHSTC